MTSGPELVDAEVVEATELPPAAVEPREAPTAVSARRPRGLLALTAVLLVVAVTASTLAVVFYTQRRDDRDRTNQVRATASDLVAALTTYDYTNLDAYRARVVALATGTFRQQFDQAFDPLRQTLAATQARSVGRVTKVYVGDIGDGAADAVVLADQVVTTSTGRQEVPSQQLTVSLVHSGGRWRVDGLSYDVVGSGGTGGAAAPSTTPTTAAASPPTTR